MKRYKILEFIPDAAYCGSTIQQNYNETIDNHGFILWDIKGKKDVDFKFVELQNPKPFVTIDWSGSANDIFNIAKKYPNGARYRVRSNQHLSQQELQSITTILKDQYNAVEVTFKIDQSSLKKEIALKTITIEKHDLRNHEILLSLIKDHYKNVDDLEISLDEISNLTKKYVSQLNDSSDSTRNIKWNLRRIEFDNTFAYGESNVVNFDSLDGIVGIFGQNRAGKSSIVGTIMYSLFNATDRGPMKNQYVCNVRKPYCLTRSVVNVAGVDYLIERQTTKYEKKGNVGSITSLNTFRIENDGKITDIAGEQRNDTEKVIKSLIGTSDDFLLTSLSSQGDINQFISHGSSQRRKILSRFLDLDIFDKMHEFAKLDYVQLKANLKALPLTESNTIEFIENEIASCESQISSYDKQIHQLDVELNELISVKHKYDNVKIVSKSDVDKQRAVVMFAQKNLTAAEENLAQLKVEIADLKDKKNKLELQSNNVNLEELEKNIHELSRIKASITDCKRSIELNDHKLSSYQKSVKTLKMVPCGDSYPTCMYIKDAHENKTNLQTALKVSVELEQNLKALENTLKSYVEQELSKKYETIKKINQLKIAIDDKLQFSEEKIKSYELSIVANKSILDNETEKFNVLNECLNNREIYELESIDNKIKNIRASLKGLHDQRLTRVKGLGVWTNKLQEQRSAFEKRIAISNSMKSHEIVMNAFSKKGLPHAIVATQLPQINAEIANILAGIVDFTIEIEAEDETESLEVYINYGDSRRIIELASGMEKMMASIAIRVALINVSSLPKTNMFIIDEGFGALDDAGVEACNRLLVSLKKYFKTVIVITHVDGVKDCVDTMLEITKSEKDSKIVYDLVYARLERISEE